MGSMDGYVFTTQCRQILVPDWFIKGLVCAPKRSLGVYRKEKGIVTGSGFMFVADMSITVTKGDF